MVLRILGLILLLTAAVTAGEKQTVAAVYEFGCVLSVEKTSATRVVIPLDDDGKEQRDKAYMTGIRATLMGADCAHTEIQKSNSK